MGNTDTREGQRWLAGFWTATSALSQQNSILVFRHHPKGSFSLLLNPPHLPLHFTKESLIQMISSFI